MSVKAESFIDHVEEFEQLAGLATTKNEKRFTKDGIDRMLIIYSALIIARAIRKEMDEVGEMK